VNAAQDYACYGPYDKNFGVKTPGGGAQWHPGKIGHELRGDVLAFFVLSILDDALATIQREQLEALEEIAPAPSLNHAGAVNVKPGSVQTPEARVLKKQQSFLHQRNVIPAINEGIYKVAQKYLGKHIGGGGAKKLLARHPARWCGEEICGDHVPQCFTDYEPRVSSGFSEVVLESEWERGLSFFDRNGVQKSIDKGLGYIDRKYIYLSTGVGSKISFYANVLGQSNEGPVAKMQAKTVSKNDTHVKSGAKSGGGLETSVEALGGGLRRALAGGGSATHTNDTAASTAPTSRLYLCEVQKGFLQYPADMDDLLTGALVDVYLDAGKSSLISSIRHNNTQSLSAFVKDLPVARRKRLNLVAFKDYCYATDLFLPAGHHVVTISQKTDKRINLAYVLFK